jgi:hypothetical protein
VPYTTLVAGTTITASWANASVRDQGVTPFTTAAARTSAITSPVNGMVSVLTSGTMLLDVYNGRWISYLYPTQATVATTETTVSTVFTDLATTGPAVTVVTGTSALVTLSAVMSTSSSGNPALMGYAVTSASAISALDANAAWNAGTTSVRSTSTYLETGLTAGSNIFTAKYRTPAGTSTFQNRQIIVQPLP